MNNKSENIDSEPILIAKIFLNQGKDIFKEFQKLIAIKENNNTTGFNQIPTMRTIKETAQITKLPEYLVRQLVNSNQIVHIRCGNKKILINLEKFIEFLNTHKGNNKEKNIKNKYGIEQIN